MPFKDPEANRQYRREYKRTQRKNPVFRDAERARERELQPERRRKNPKPQLRREAAVRFVGVDGEGWERGGRHEYMMLCAGAETLYDGRPLTFTRIATWLHTLPNPDGHNVYVAFFFDYDSTMILRSLVAKWPQKVKELCEPDQGFAFSWFGDWGVSYVPRKHLTIHNSVTKKTVTIHDTQSFFQMSFVAAITKFGIGSEQERAEIAAKKAQRADFETVDVAEIKTYCLRECRLLEDLAQHIKDRFADLQLSMYPYEGPGPIAGRILRQKIGKCRELPVPEPVLRAARASQYGGRIEISAHGPIDRPVYAADLNSAYPSAMARVLPCLVHGKWKHRVYPNGSTRRQSLSDPEISFQRVESNVARSGYAWDKDPVGIGRHAPLPVRGATGRVVYPEVAAGWYSSVEIRDTEVTVLEEWVYERQCECKPFTWVEELYRDRKVREAESPGSGIAHKLVLNSLYGKTAQTIGAAPHFQPVWASLITGWTRGEMYSVYKRHPGKIVMMATDALYSLEPLEELDYGKELGQWSAEGPYSDLCIFMPGLYFDRGSKCKTRGLPHKAVSERTAEFRAMSDRFDESVAVTFEHFRGIRECVHNGPNWFHRIGQWESTTRGYTSHPGTKRQIGHRVDADGCLRSWMHWSGPEGPETDPMTLPDGEEYYTGATTDVILDGSPDWQMEE